MILLAIIKQSIMKFIFELFVKIPLFCKFCNQNRHFSSYNERVNTRVVINQPFYHLETFQVLRGKLNYQTVLSTAFLLQFKNLFLANAILPK